MPNVPRPFYGAGMVGNPKRLEDLEKIDAGVKVTCKACRRERLVSRERLIHDLTRKGLSTSWDMLPHRLRCACGSKAVDIVAMPFTSGEEDGEMLFEALIRAFERNERALRTGRVDGDGCREMSECARELHVTKVAMRAWIVARS